MTICRNPIMEVSDKKFSWSWSFHRYHFIWSKNILIRLYSKIYLSLILLSTQIFFFQIEYLGRATRKFVIYSVIIRDKQQGYVYIYIYIYIYVFFMHYRRSCHDPSWTICFYFWDHQIHFRINISEVYVAICNDPEDIRTLSDPIEILSKTACTRPRDCHLWRTKTSHDMERHCISRYRNT